MFRSVAGESEEEGEWVAYMNASKRSPIQEIQLQHTYADVR
jgi:hypothetical protein